MSRDTLSAFAICANTVTIMFPRLFEAGPQRDRRFACQSMLYSDRVRCLLLFVNLSVQFACWNWKLMLFWLFAAVPGFGHLNFRLCLYSALTKVGEQSGMFALRGSVHSRGQQGCGTGRGAAMAPVL